MSKSKRPKQDSREAREDILRTATLNQRLLGLTKVDLQALRDLIDNELEMHKLKENGRFVKSPYGSYYLSHKDRRILETIRKELEPFFEECGITPPERDTK